MHTAMSRMFAVSLLLIGALPAFADEKPAGAEPAAADATEEGKLEKPNEELPVAKASTCPKEQDELKTGTAIIHNHLMRIHVGGQLQFQSALFTGEDNLLANGDLAEQEGFRIRRARIKVGGDMGKMVSFSLAVELHDKEDSGGTLVDAFLDFHPIEYFGLKAGAFELPFARSTEISSTRQALVERPMGVRFMAPRRQAGATVYTELWDERIRLEMGVFNALNRSDAGFYGGYDPISQTLGNTYGRFVYAARLDFAPLGAMNASMPDLTKDKRPRLNLGGGFFYNDGTSYKVTAFTGDIHFKWYGFALLGGYLFDTTSPSDDPNTVTDITTEFDRSAWFVEADYTILRRLLGVHARYEWLDTNSAVENEGDQSLASLGFAVYAMDQLVKVQVDYQLRMEREGKDLDNDSLMAQLQLVF